MLELRHFQHAGIELYVRVLRAHMDQAIVREVERDYMWERFASGSIATAIDVGAHIGSWTLHLKRDHPEARVVAIEAEPENALLLALNCWEVDGIFTHHAWCGYADDNRVLVRSRINSGGHVVASKAAAALYDDGRIMALPERLGLEQVMALHGLEHVDLLKLDCEGSEHDILNHVGDGTLARIERIIGEHHGSSARFDEELRPRLLKAGMHVEYLPHPKAAIGIFYATR